MVRAAAVAVQTCPPSPRHRRMGRKSAAGKKKQKKLVSKMFILLSLCFSSTPIGEWPSPRPTPCRTCRMPPSTATMTAVWRNQRLPAANRRLVLASDPWPCPRTTTRGPLQMAASERPSTLKMVRWQSTSDLLCFPMNMYLNVNGS